MTNPNNCATCDHSEDPEGGHCYMFKRAPEVACSHHTGRTLSMSMFANHSDFIRALRDAALTPKEAP